MIEAAFAGVTLGIGVGLREAQGLDDYADAKTRAAYRATDEKTDWRRIPWEELNACFSSLSFFDAEGMRFHLPAYILADLSSNYHATDLALCLAHLSEYDIGQLALLSTEQRRAVRAYLLHAANYAEEESDRLQFLRIIEDYWTEPDQN